MCRVALGELALNGEVRSVRGSVGAAMVARRLERLCLLAPEAAAEASRVRGSDVRGAPTLVEAVAIALGRESGTITELAPVSGSDSGHDLAEIRGQLVARRALEVAAAGGHHLLLFGSPGAGKTMLAASLPTVLPQLTDDEGLEVALVWGRAKDVATCQSVRLRRLR